MKGLKFMADHNFWDDRTAEHNDDYFCPIIDGYCVNWDCEECKKQIEFIEAVKTHTQQKEGTL